MNKRGVKKFVRKFKVKKFSRYYSAITWYRFLNTPVTKHDIKRLTKVRR